MNNHNIFSNINNEEEEFNNSTNLIDLLLYSSMGIRNSNNNYQNDNIRFFNSTIPEENFVYTSNVYRFDTDTTTNLLTNQVHFHCEYIYKVIFKDNWNNAGQAEQPQGNLHIPIPNLWHHHNSQMNNFNQPPPWLNNNDPIQHYNGEIEIPTLLVEKDTIPNHIKEMIRNTSQDCPVCFTVIEKNKMEITECGHIFCKDCITNWIGTKDYNEKNNDDCPTCRKKLF